MIVAGMMSGTSADGIDGALVDFSPTPGGDELQMHLLGSVHRPFPQPLRDSVLRLLEPGDVGLEILSRVDAEIGHEYARAAEDLMEVVGDAPPCRLVVIHGQTVRHDVVDGRVTGTLQIGQPAWVAERTGLPVLSDVRSADVAAGGQGAPLAGLLDVMLLRGAGQKPLRGDPPRTRAALNLGGIANLTVVPSSGPPISFDTGPANALLDLMARRVTEEAQDCDLGGRLAARGDVDDALLADLLTEPYYRRTPPKSTGKELFHAGHLDHHLAEHPDPTPEDVMATLTRLTAVTVAKACREHRVGEVIASGGGTRNPTLMAALRDELGDAVAVTTTDAAWGLPERDKEAVLMSLIGWFGWHGLPLPTSALTGAARHPRSGRITPGRGPLRMPEPLDAAPHSLRIVDRPGD